MQIWKHKNNKTVYGILLQPQAPFVQNSDPKDFLLASSSDTGKISLSVAVPKCLESLQVRVVSKTRELYQKCVKEQKVTEEMGGGTAQQSDCHLSWYEPSLGNPSCTHRKAGRRAVSAGLSSIEDEASRQQRACESSSAGERRREIPTQSEEIDEIKFSPKDVWLVLDWPFCSFLFIINTQLTKLFCIQGGPES